MLVSFFITAKLLAHGLYNKLKIKNETALGSEKLITLVGTIKLWINVFWLDVLLQIAIVETISSFAKTPTIKAETMPALFKPIGAKMKDSLLAMKNRILFEMSWAYCKLNKTRNDRKTNC